MDYTLNTRVSEISGIGTHRAAGLAKLGIAVLEDALRHYPRSYEDRRRFINIRDASDGERAAIRGTVLDNPKWSFIRKGMDLVRFNVADDTGTLAVTYFNQQYQVSKFSRGEEYAFYGKVQREGQFISMANPETERVGMIVPVYALTAGITSNLIRGLVDKALAAAVTELAETLPDDVLTAHNLLGLLDSYRAIHFPDALEGDDDTELHRARRRLVFEEFFTLSLALAVKRRRGEAQSAYKITRTVNYEDFYSALPFSPTDAQKRVVEEAERDLISGKVMNRLLQGDVGSGKTLVAAALIWRVCAAGYQAAFMAPTEILAEQHHKTLTRLLAPYGIRIVLLRGSMNAKEKREVRKLIKSGEARLAIGTHALLTANTQFFKLALTIADEQHRFGVAQRIALASKSVERPGTLLMSATPIPRTLAMMMYGDLDVSVLDELPPGRQSVKTYPVTEAYRERVNNFITKTAASGSRVYIICPAIEDNPNFDARSVTTYSEQLRAALPPNIRIASLHGKMKPAEKDEIMSGFADGGIDVLVSTTVVEVGMDVPDATLIVIENAERFGLSQLHQLRGRVGRGARQSYCIPVLGGGGGQDAVERLKAFAATTDGFRIAEADLRMRGPGDFFGNRQHGLPELKISDLQGSMSMMKEAQSAAEHFGVERIEAYPALRQRIERLLRSAE
ncbi:MAG: ATP-dependent DNA helicase RecG [Oscillospiraceae bacterium]|jgi:ATP-dependent DNA helicase RecG|nr:ATP-dependent DNA helicase RecG [Oscillospiraceae bacterium]